jgi:hypothetical protein
LTDEQRSELRKWAASRTLPAGDVFRARLILALADGQTYSPDQGDAADHGAHDFALEAEV